MERVVQGGQGFNWQPGMTQGLNLRGQSVDLYVLPTVAVYAPFYVSSAGYGVYVESDWPGTYRFGVTATGKVVPTEVTIEYEGPELVLRSSPARRRSRPPRATAAPWGPPSFPRASPSSPSAGATRSGTFPRSTTARRAPRRTTPWSWRTS